MRKIFGTVMSVAMGVCLALGLASCAGRGPVELRFELNEETDTYTVFAANNKSGKKAVIPSSYEGKSVTAIGERAFADFMELTSITIPDSVTSIGDYAFSSCYQITSVSLPDGLTSIGRNAFEFCDIIDIRIPAATTSIGAQAFYTCRKVESITVAQGNPVYDSAGNCLIETATNKLIAGCMNSVIPDGVTAIGDYAFYACFGLGKIDIPDSVNSIGNSAFAHCLTLRKVEIGSGVTSIGEEAFKYSDEFGKITFRGTTTEWKAITKGEDWRKHADFLSLVVCSDGTLTDEDIG